MKVQNRTLLYDFLIWMVSLSKRLVFHSVEEFFSEDRDTLSSPYPTALLANHVSEQDVVSLSFVYRRLSPKIKMIIPAREDLLRPSFLQKEFTAKGFLGMVFAFIDFTRIIPMLIRYIGGVPIKRPFRDNARELLRSGELRDKVEAEWSMMVNEIRKGRNLFMFPEGVFNQDGYLGQVKKGAYYLKSKIPKLQFNSFTLTYDHLSFPKTKLCIQYGKPFSIEGDWSADKVIRFLADKLGENYVVSLGNLTSFILLQWKENTPLPKMKLIQLLEQMRAGLQKIAPKLAFTKEILNQIDVRSLDHLLALCEKKNISF